MQRRRFLAGSLTFACTPLGFTRCLLAATDRPPSRESPPGKVEGEVDRLQVRIGLHVVRLFIGPGWPPFLERLRRLRSDLRTAGIHMPLVRIRDDLKLPNDEYVILIRGSIVFRGRLPAPGLHDEHGVILAHLAKVVRSHVTELSG